MSVDASTAAASRSFAAEPLTAAAFAPFGDVIEAMGESFPINGGLCDRFHDRARMEFTGDGRAGISVGLGRPYPLPLTFSLVERHPLGSQAFVPMHGGSLPRRRRPRCRRTAGDAAGVPDRAGAGRELPAQCLARGAHPARSPGAVPHRRPDRIGEQPRGVHLRRAVDGDAAGLSGETSRGPGDALPGRSCRRRRTSSHHHRQSLTAHTPPRCRQPYRGARRRTASPEPARRRCHPDDRQCAMRRSAAARGVWSLVRREPAEGRLRGVRRPGRRGRRRRAA